MLSEGTVYFIKVAAVAWACLFAYQSYSEWSDERVAAKARAAMPPAARLAADNADRQRAQAKALADQAEARKGRARDACMRGLFNSLHDPVSAQLTWTAGSFDAAGVFNGFIEGRAKNGFGALRLAAWNCQVTEQNGSMVVQSINQYQR